MRGLIIMILIITNIALVIQIYLDGKERKEQELNKQICIQEMIPEYELEIIGD